MVVPAMVMVVTWTRRFMGWIVIWRRWLRWRVSTRRRWICPRRIAVGRIVFVTLDVLVLVVIATLVPATLILVIAVHRHVSYYGPAAVI
jgi:hypothetical protein